MKIRSRIYVLIGEWEKEANQIDDEIQHTDLCDLEIAERIGVQNGIRACADHMMRQFFPELTTLKSSIDGFEEIPF